MVTPADLAVAVAGDAPTWPWALGLGTTAHNRGDHPRIDPVLTVNFYVHMDPASRTLEVTSARVPAVPEELSGWVKGSAVETSADKLLE